MVTGLCHSCSSIYNVAWEKKNRQLRLQVWSLFRKKNKTTMRFTVDVGQWAILSQGHLWVRRHPQQPPSSHAVCKMASAESNQRTVEGGVWRIYGRAANWRLVLLIHRGHGRCEDKGSISLPPWLRRMNIFRASIIKGPFSEAALYVWPSQWLGRRAEHHRHASPCACVWACVEE